MCLFSPLTRGFPVLRQNTDLFGHWNETSHLTRCLFSPWSSSTTDTSASQATAWGAWHGVGTCWWDVTHARSCLRWMSGCLQERWSSDRTKPQCVFLSTSIIHLWSILHSLKLEFYLRVLSDEGKVVMSYLPPSVVKLATYLIDPLNYNSSRANK